MSYQQYFIDAHNTLSAIAGIGVFYRRGDAFVLINAIPSKTEFGVNDSGDIDLSVYWVSRDYKFSIDDLYLDGVAITPQKGDIIEEAIGGKKYQVTRTDGGDQLWSYCDNYWGTLKVHTREVR